MKKKYELTDETKIVDGHILHRIRALKDFNNVKKGELGGYVESTNNLSQDGLCWIFDNSNVYENARVSGDARILGIDVKIYGNAEVYDNVRISGHACICDDAKVYGNAKVWESSRIFDEAHIYGSAKVFGDTWVFKDAQIAGTAEIWAGDFSFKAFITTMDDYIVFNNIGSTHSQLTAYKTINNVIMISHPTLYGWFSGCIDEFTNHIHEIYKIVPNSEYSESFNEYRKEKHDESYKKYIKEYDIILELIKTRFQTPRRVLMDSTIKTDIEQIEKDALDIIKTEEYNAKVAAKVVELKAEQLAKETFTGWQFPLIIKWRGFRKS